MQFKTTVTIHGAKPVDFKSDDGRHYDYVALFVEMPLDGSLLRAHQVQAKH